jgi:hypothetical protein
VNVLVNSTTRYFRRNILAVPITGDKTHENSDDGNVDAVISVPTFDAVCGTPFVQIVIKFRELRPSALPSSECVSASAS